MCKQEALSLPPPCHLKGVPGVSSAAHATIPGVNLLTSPWAERTRPPRTLCRILCRQCLALRDDPVVGPKPEQTHTRTLPRHRTFRRFSDHALHLPSREVGRSPKPTPIRHVGTHHSRSCGPGPAPQRVCFRQNSRHIEPTPARCCSLRPRSMSPV